MTDPSQGVPFMPTTDDAPEWLTRKQFAAALQVHVGTVSRWINANPDMCLQRFGPANGRVRIHRDELNRYRTVPPGDTDTAQA